MAHVTFCLSCAHQKAFPVKHSKKKKAVFVGEEVQLIDNKSIVDTTWFKLVLALLVHANI